MICTIQLPCYREGKGGFPNLKIKTYAEYKKWKVSLTKAKNK